MGGSLHYANFPDRLRILLALLALCKAHHPCPHPWREGPMPYSLSREFGFVIWGLLLGGYVIGRLRTRVLLALRATGNASEGARPSPAGAAGRHALTASPRWCGANEGGTPATPCVELARRSASAQQPQCGLPRDRMGRR